MPLKIFISSVSIEFDAERKALEREIHQLGEVYAGMEYFGSDPRTAVSFDDAAVSQTDLYVGLFGDKFGSTATESGKSFTELEYESARARQIPTLVYFKNAFVTAAEEPQQAIFKQRVQAQQLGAVFKSVHELEIQFLIDLFKQSRGPLFAKLRPQLGAIPFDALHAITKSLLPEQVKIVGRDKYIQKLYVHRTAQNNIREFFDFEEYFNGRTQEILAGLKSIAEAYLPFDVVRLALQHMNAALLHIQDWSELLDAVAMLKRVYHFDSIEEDFAALATIDRESNAAKNYRLVQEIITLLRSRPYIDRPRLNELMTLIPREARGRVAGGADSLVKHKDIRRSFPSIDRGNETILANDLVKELIHLIEKSSKCCVALVDRAGRGKTNLVCHVAEGMIEKNAVVLLSGRMEISSEYDIEWHIQRQIETAFGAAFADWMRRSAAGLEHAHRWLFIILDGINESTNLPLFVKILQNFLPKLAGMRIKLILSCRDIYWELFRPSLKPYLFQDAISLSEFSEQDWKRATELYFHQFQITADVQAQAALSLRNPLLLRFFCEAYQGGKLGLVTDVHLRSVFKLYIERVSRSIVERKGLLDSNMVLHLLLQVVGAMWQSRLPAVEQARMGLTPEEISSSESIYNLVRSENVILDEARHVNTASKIVRFVYDEFMEYMLAQYWLTKNISGQENDSEVDMLLQQAMDAVVAFPAALGAIFFLDEMLGRNGQLVNRAISSSGPVLQVLLRSRQASLLQALEHINTGNVDDELLNVVNEFEMTVADELRPRLSGVLTNLLEKNPGRSALRPAIARMLNVDPVASSSPVKKKEDEELLLLPPARYHYSEETKLNAIALIIGSRSSEDYELAEQAMRKLGRMDLHAALYALKSVDMADDDVVYKTIENHMKAPLPEYRIYCAWLLRERYGTEPARFLLKLLSADETRVHTYTFSLFETRQIEKELLDGILAEMRAFNVIKPWLLIYRVKLLARRTAFLPAQIEQSSGQAVVEVLKFASKHPKANIRLAAFRALSVYPEFVDRSTIADWMRADSDAHVRALAVQMGN
jgi:hypothetical protein